MWSESGRRTLKKYDWHQGLRFHYRYLPVPVEATEKLKEISLKTYGTSVTKIEVQKPEEDFQ